MADGKQFPGGSKGSGPLPSNPSSASSSATSSSAATKPLVLSKRSLQDLVKQVDANEQLDEDVEDVLLNYAEEYMEGLIEGACILASHRKGNTVEVKDVHTHLERTGNAWIPGYGSDELKPYKRAPVTEAHKQRMALIKKTLKKY